jgi:hypothetical protein
MREVPRGAGMTPAGEAGEAEMGKWSVELVWSISHLRQLYLSKSGCFEFRNFTGEKMFLLGAVALV